MTENDETDDFREIATTAIPEVTSVRFYDETVEHIALHPEMRILIPSLEAAIDDTIANPTEVYRSNAPHVDSFKYRSSNYLHGDKPMVVAVKIVEGTSALLKTAYFPATCTGTQVKGEDSEA